MRLAATVTETQYGRWVASLLGSGLGETKDGRPVLHAILAPLQVSMTLLAVALGAGYGLAFLFIRFNRNRRPRRRPGYRRATLIALAVIVSIPGGGAYVFSSVAGEDGEALTTPTVAGLLASTLIAALTILSTLARRGSPASGLVHVSKLYERATNEQQRFRPTLAPLAGDAALVLLALLVTEGLTRLEGLARLTKSAATTGDFSLLMALGLTGTLTALILGLVSDAALGAPRRLSGLLGEERH